MSTSARPESGLTSSITESWTGPAPTPANHWLDTGTPQSWVLIGLVPDRSPRRPGARSSLPCTTAGPAPGSGVTAPVVTGTVRVLPPVPTVRSPELPLAVDTPPSGDVAFVEGQTIVAPVRRVSDGACVASCTGG